MSKGSITKIKTQQVPILQKASPLPRSPYFSARHPTITQKVSAMKHIKEPSNVEELQHFLSLIGYYRKFILLLTDVTRPLQKLLRKDTKFQWSQQCQPVFDISNKFFVRNSSCSLPLWKKPTVCSLMPVFMHILASSPRQLTVLLHSCQAHSWKCGKSGLQPKWRHMQSISPF